MNKGVVFDGKIDEVAATMNLSYKKRITYIVE